jgi:hypothetical protein
MKMTGSPSKRFNRFPYDMRTVEIMALIQEKGGRVKRAGFTKEVVKKCDSWGDYREYDVRGGNISVGRRFSRMRNNSLIRFIEEDGVEYIQVIDGRNWRNILRNKRATG